MKWYYAVELAIVSAFLFFTIIGGSFVIVTQIKKPYIPSSKVNPIIIQLFVAAELIVIQGSFLIPALIDENQLILHQQVCMLNDALITIGLTAHSFTLVLAAVDRLFLICRPLKYNELTRKQVIIPGALVAGFASLLAWSWRLATQRKFNITLQYVSYLGMCHVDLEPCYQDIDQEGGTESVMVTHANHSSTERVLVNTGATNRSILSEEEKRCIHSISYSDLTDICFVLGSYLPLIATIVVFGISYRLFVKRCAASVNTRRSTMMGRQTVKESIIFNNRSVRLGGETSEVSEGRRISVDEIELKDYRPKSNRVTINTREVLRKPENPLQDNNATIQDAVRDENDSKLSPRAPVILFQEGPSVPADLLVDHSPDLGRLSFQILDKPEDDQEDEAPVRKPVFRNNITRHQLATTRCLMITTIATFIAQTVFFVADIAMRKSTGVNEKRHFPLSLCFSAIGFMDFVIVGVFNSYVRKDVVRLFRYCLSSSDT